MYIPQAPPDDPTTTFGARSREYTCASACMPKSADLHAPPEMHTANDDLYDNRCFIFSSSNILGRYVFNRSWYPTYASRSSDKTGMFAIEAAGLTPITITSMSVPLSYHK